MHKRLCVKLSIVIPIYNSENYLDECLDSVCKQIKKEVEIILINDCSTDKSVQICKKYLKKYKFLKLINIKKNKGVSYCRNLGIKNSLGKYVCFLDSDDKYLKGSIAIILYHVKKFCKNELFILRNQDSYQKVVDKNQFFQLKANNNISSISNIIKNFDKFRATCWNFVIKKKFLQSNNIKFKNIQMYEDQVFVSHILCLVKKYKIISKPVYELRQVNQNSLSKQTGYIVVKACLRVVCEISKIIYMKKIVHTRVQVKLLLARLNFIDKILLLNILVCNKSEINKINKYLFKRFSTISKLFPNYKKKILKYQVDKKLFFKNLVDKINGSKIILFCAGSYSKIILKNLIRLGVKTNFVIDNNINYSGQTIDKIIILNPKFLEKNLYEFINYKFLICHRNKLIFDKIRRQLNKIGFKKINIIHVSI